MKLSSNLELTSFLEKHFSNQTPFVAYKKPNLTKISVIHQPNDTINYLNNFKASGFIFAPFDWKNNAIFFSKESDNFAEFNLDSHYSKYSFQKEFKQVKGENHETLVQKGIEYIQQGNASKIVLSRVERQTIANYYAVTHFINLCLTYSNAFCYVWFHPKIGTWLGATPETLVNSNGFTFKTMSLAGTKKVEQNIKPQWQGKEKEEQEIVTNYIVKELQKNTIDCSKSNVKTIKAGNLFHLQTIISGKVNNQLETIIKTLHPTPAVCGYPTNIAKDFILTNENYNREFYTGFLGELNIPTSKLSNKRNIENYAYKRQIKETNLFVNLRCMKVTNNEISIFVGGGITAESNPKKEFIETQNKANTIKNSL